MWLTPAWQAAITIFGGIITVVVLPVMLDAKIPSTNYTIPQYTRDAMLIYWLAKVEPFNNSISEGTTDIPTTANFHHIASSDTAVSTTAPDVDSFEAAKLSVPEPFFDCTAPEADSFETAELPDEWFELRVQPSSDKEHHIFVLQLMHDILACLEVLPALGVYLIVFTTLSCIWLRWKAPKTKRAVSIHLDLVKALQNSTSSATPLIPPALLDVLEAASPDQQSLVDDTAALDPQLNGTPPPLLYEQGQTRFVKYRNVKAAKAQARRRRAVATPHRAAGAYDTQQCDPKLLDVTAQVEGHKKQSDSNFLDTTAIQGRLVNLEKSFKDLTTDKLSKDTQIAKLQDDQKNTSLKITEQSIEIKTLNKKLQDEVQDHRKLQTKLQVFSDKTDCWQQNVEGVLNQSHVDVTDEIKQVKFLIRHVETTLSKSLQDLQGAFTDVENRMGAFERDLKSLQGNVAGVGNRTEACEKGLNGLQDTFTGVETRTKAYEKRLNDLQGSIADVEHRTEVCEMSLNGLSPLQEAFVKAENKLETVEKQVAAIKTKDLPKIVNEQKVLRDRLNGVSAEVQRLTGAKPKKKRQRHRPRREEDPASDSGDEDGAGPGPGSQRTPSPASSKPDSQTPACDSSRDSINDKSSKSPPTSPDSTGTGPTEQSNRANDNSSDLAPESQESNGTGPKESPRPPASSPTSPPEDTPKEDPETGGNESGKDVPDSKGSSEPRTPRPTLREEPQAPFTEPKAAQNLTGDKCYDALGVQFDATPGRIRKAYKARASLVHPDKNKNDPGASHEAFVFLGEAYRVLSDLKEKKAYDRARINGTTYEPAPASDGFVPDTTPLPSAARPVDLEILGKVLEARISDRIWNLKKRPGAWKFSAMMLRPTALEELMKEDPDQPWPVC